MAIALAGFQQQRDLILGEAVVTGLRDFPKQVVDAPIEIGIGLPSPAERVPTEILPVRAELLRNVDGVRFGRD